jgi:hypothetical protein
VAAERITAEQARADVEKGSALLVCAYDSEAKYRENYLPEAISLDALRAQENSIPRNREIIFYCS